MADLQHGETAQEGKIGEPVPVGGGVIIRAGGEHRAAGLASGAMVTAQHIHEMLLRLLARLELPTDRAVIPAEVEHRLEPMLEEAVRLETAVMRMLENAHHALDPEPPEVQMKRPQRARNAARSAAVARREAEGAGDNTPASTGPAA